MQTQIQSCIQDVTQIAAALGGMRRRPPDSATTALSRLLATLGELAGQAVPDEPLPPVPEPDEGVPAQSLVPAGGWAAAAGVSTGAVPPPLDPEVARLQAAVLAAQAKLAGKTPIQKAQDRYLERRKAVTVVGNGGRVMDYEAELAGTQALHDYLWACGSAPDIGHSFTAYAPPEGGHKPKDAAKLAKADVALNDRDGFRAKVKAAIERSLRERRQYLADRMHLRSLTPGRPDVTPSWYERNTIWGQRQAGCWDPESHGKKKGA